MKQYQLLLAIALVLFFQQTANSQVDAIDNPGTWYDETGNEKKHLNFFVISKRKKGKLDPATRFNTLRTKLRGLFRRKSFVSIVAEDADQMSSRIQDLLRSNDATIGTIWFDSHGAYKKGYSLFSIGNSEISSITLKDKKISAAFSDLAPFATAKTKLVIGSCYGGATYTRVSVDYKDSTRMNGDTLMIKLGKLLCNGEVFGSEAWVMSKPGLFNRRPAAGGAPARKLFLDLCYEPVWSRVGQWNQYSTLSNAFQQVNTVSLDKKGNMVIRGRPYCEEKKYYEDVQKKLTKLQLNLYK